MWSDNIGLKTAKKQLKQQHQQQQRQCLILDNMNVNQQVRGASANNDPKLESSFSSHGSHGNIRAENSFLVH